MKFAPMLLINIPTIDWMINGRFPSSIAPIVLTIKALAGGRAQALNTPQNTPLVVED